MARSVDISGLIRLQKPCPVEWDSMRPQGAGRHCEHCDLVVHDLSKLTRSEAAALLNSGGARLCVNSYTAADGTLLTRDDLHALRGSRSVELFRRAVSRLCVMVGLGAVAAAVGGCGRTGGKIMRTGGDVVPLRERTPVPNAEAVMPSQ